MPLAKIALGPGSLFIDGDWVESKDLADDGIRYITTGNVGEGRYKEQGSGYISQAKFDELRCTEVLPGDVLISRLNLPIGRACVVPDLGERIITSVDNVITRPDSGYSRAYLAYMLSSASHFANMEILARGTTMQRISRSTLGQVRFAFPTEEQTTIATFLDRETAKIDALVAEQEKLIALLQEKRQAVISHAVTKGLDPNVTMKDSGVEWLGEVPGHWEVRQLKHLARLTTGMTPPTDEHENYEENGFPWVRPEDIDESGAITKASKFLSEKGKALARLIPAGASLICCIGTIGKVGIVDENVSTNQQITAATFLGDPRYFYFTTCAARVELENSATGNVLKILNTERLGETKYPSPPLTEQTTIAIYLDSETAKLDTLMYEARTAIILLQERRTALISAAVTGQIDVRGLAGSANAPDSVAASAYPASA
ncbi:restriction endonuclease subunit S [Acidovorax soli]|uniref:restriction endonuclease subunit S n=1 Tax=Acidovorax soli TaxID=592050 RepID=UPI0032B13938